MKRFFYITVASVLVVLTSLLLSLPTPDAASELARTEMLDSTSGLFIENVYVTDNAGQREQASVVIRNGVIERVSDRIDAPDGAAVLDGTGLTAIPGLIDSHTHSYGSSLEDALRFGVVASIDMFSPPSVLPQTTAARDAVAKTLKADLFSAGMLATVKGGHGTQFGVAVEPLDAQSDIDQWVQTRKAEGSDFIKLVYMPYQSRIPSLDRAMAKTVIEAAHTHGLMALAHISTQRAARDMIEDGINGLVHIFADEEVSPSLLELAVKRDVFVIPTLAVIASVAQRPNPMVESDDIRKWLSPMQRQTLESRFPAIPKGFNFDIALTNVLRLHQAGVKVLAGSDAPNPGTAHGISLHHEMALLVEAGLTAQEAMRAATTLPVEVFGLKERGVLKPGSRADILLVQGNPYQNISASRNVRHVIKNGYLVTRKDTELETAPQISDSMLGTFDQDMNGPSGLVWGATDDSVMGGNSVASVDRVPRPGNGHALSVRAEVKAGFAWPWAGAGLASQNPANALDVSAYQSVVFDIKGSPGTYRIMLFSGMGAGAPPAQEFEVTNDWRTVSLPFKQFAGFDPRIFSMMSVVPEAKPQIVQYAIDEVRFE